VFKAANVVVGALENQRALRTNVVVGTSAPYGPITASRPRTSRGRVNIVNLPVASTGH
jgi:hypothetical protein